jgi:hypothetical protein
LGGWAYLVAVLMWFGFSGPPVGHSYSRRVLSGGWSGVWSGPLLMVLGVGLCINTSMACLAGLVRSGGEFVRTPKAGDRPSSSAWRYRIRSSPTWVFELLASVYCGWSFYHFLTESENIVGAFLLIFAIGFFVVGVHSIPLGHRASRRPPVAEPVSGRTPTASALVESVSAAGVGPAIRRVPAPTSVAAPVLGED